MSSNMNLDESNDERKINLIYKDAKLSVRVANIKLSSFLVEHVENHPGNQDINLEISNFPDSSLYMIGFKFKQQSSSQ